MIKYVRLAFIEKNVEHIDRLYYAWFCTFLCRLWFTWVLTTPMNILDRGESQTSYPGSSKGREKSKNKFFISNPAYLVCLQHVFCFKRS